MSTEVNGLSSPDSNGREKLTPNSPWLVDLNVVSPVPSLDPSSVDPDNPATVQHPGYNPITGEQRAFLASEIIDARMRYREDHFPKPAKPRPMGWVR